MTISSLGFLMQITYLIRHMTFADVLDIVLVGIIFFIVFQALHQTRALQMLRGVIIIAILGGALILLLPFNTLSWLVRILLIAGVIALPLLFQDELRRVVIGLGQIGRKRGFGSGFEKHKETLLKAIRQLANQQTGALIIMEGQTPLEDIIATGIPVQAEILTPELLQTIFQPKTPLHDGAIVLRGNNLVAASCILPVQVENTGDKHLGTRHRAALGLSNKVPDALVIVVSEETGSVSVAWDGRLHPNLSTDELEGWFERFSQQFQNNGHSRWQWIRGGGFVPTIRNLLVALGLALIAWLSVSYQLNPLAQATIKDVPLVVTGLPEELLLMNQPQDTVKVQVRTMEDRLDLLDSSSVRAELPLADLSTGVHQVPVEVTTADPLAEIVSVNPHSSNVVLEPLLTRILTPTVVIMDLNDLPPGYSLEDVAVSPPVVSVSGPESQVEMVNEARIRLWLGNHRTDFQESVSSMEFLDGNGKEVVGVRSIPEQVMVSVEIEEIYFSREIAVQPVLVETTLDKDYEINQVEAEPPEVTILGAEEAVKSTGDFLATKPITLTNVFSEFITHAPLIIPNGLTALDQNGANITEVEVTIKVSPKTTYLVLDSAVSYTNLPDSLNAKVEPSKVLVLLLGPNQLLEEIRKNPDLIIVGLNLEGYTVGTYTVPLQVQSPQGVQAQVFPSTVQVTITE